MLLGLVRLFIVKILELPEEYHILHCMLRYFQNGNQIALLHLYCIFNIASYRIIEGIDRPLSLTIFDSNLVMSGFCEILGLPKSSWLSVLSDAIPDLKYDHKLYQNVAGVV